MLQLLYFSVLFISDLTGSNPHEDNMVNEAGIVAGHLFVYVGNI